MDDYIRHFFSRLEEKPKIPEIEGKRAALSVNLFWNYVLRSMRRYIQSILNLSRIIETKKQHCKYRRFF